VAARFFKHGELALVVLALLERAPMHGYQLIAELDELFGDAYEPSTGTVYPAVRALEDEGLVTSAEIGRRAVYSLTAVGRRSLARRSEQLAALEVRTGVRIRSGAELDRLLVRAREAAARVDVDKARVVLERAVEELEALGGPR
jgi:DNA-binding PadR family transcriptional regulator